MKGKNAYLLLYVWAVIACEKISDVTAESHGEDSPITFYMKAAANPNMKADASADKAVANTKSIIENTGVLIEKGPDIYVTDLSGNNPVFNDTRISHTGNGIWRSDKTWTANKEYIFYAYVSSPGNYAANPITTNNGGRSVDIWQPYDYTDDDDAWSDYLMSYRVRLNSAQNQLVQLSLERITVGVELYMAMSKGMSKVTLNSATFTNVIRGATYDMSTPAAATDAPNPTTGMRNAWTVSWKTATTDYEYAPENGLELKAFDPAASATGKFDFDSQYMIMNFLTVHQPTAQELSTGERKIQLKLSYTVVENGNNIDYEAAFDLENFTPATWTRGHKVRYYIMIDSGIDLTGSVAKWEEVDYIEGTLLPD